MAQSKSVFEHTVCGRCCGTGSYSYNQIDGSRCYGCDGTGNKYTRRGLVARNWWKAQREMVAADVQVGMRIQVCGTEMTVATVEPYSQKFATDGVWKEETWLSIQQGDHGVSVPPNYKVLRVLKGAEARELLQKAVAYQATLNEKGEPAA
jgi:hypothetical protein